MKINVDKNEIYVHLDIVHLPIFGSFLLLPSIAEPKNNSEPSSSYETVALKAFSQSPLICFHLPSNIFTLWSALYSFSRIVSSLAIAPSASLM